MRAVPSKGAALVEFALAWPVALLLVLGAVQVTLWSSESFAARAAILAGARAATVEGSSPDVAVHVAVRVLQPAIFGTSVRPSCARGAAPGLGVCARDLGDAVEVDVDGTVPALVPLLGGGLPVDARVVLQKELFTR